MVDGSGSAEDKFFNITSYGRSTVRFESDVAAEHDQNQVLERIFIAKAL